MALPSIPTAAEVRIASRLRPEQVSIAFPDTNAMEADISDRIAEQENYVEMRITQSAAPTAWPFTSAMLGLVYPGYDSDAIIAIGTRQGGIAALAVKLLTIGDLYDSAGQLNERYQAEADNYRARGEALLTQLTGELEWQVTKSGADAEGDGLSMLTIQVGENFSSDEYS